MAAPDGFRITQHVPGGEPTDLTRDATAANWTSSVPGGFGAATVTVPRVLPLKGRGFLGSLTIEHEGRVLFEGRVEDAFTRGAKGSVQTDLNAFGLQRLLTDNSVRRIWSLRSGLSPTQSSIAQGSNTSGVMAIDSTYQYIFGLYDTAQPGKFGFRIALTDPVAVLASGQVGIALPTGITGASLLFDADFQGADANFALAVHSSADGSFYSRHLEQHTPVATMQSYVLTLVDGAIDIRFAATAAGGTASEGVVEISNIRVLGPTGEDVPGGIYGGTILRGVIPLAAGLYPGTIEDGSDFVIAEFERVTRSSLLDVVQQIDPLYAKEWGVWEGGRFDWITPDLKAGGWLVPLADATEWSIEQSIDSVHRRTYVTFTDAADNQVKEAVVESTDARNPYVRTGTAKDGIVAAPAAMTSITAPMLAAKLNNDFGRWPDIKGSVTLMAQTIVAQTGNGTRTVPAFAIRAGDNITIPDLPVEDIYAAGQDGQTVFHVTGVQASTDGTVVLTLEGLTRRADVLLARIGAVSQ